MTLPAPSSASLATDRQRLSLDLAPPISSLLDHISAVTGVPKSQVVLQAVLEALPALLERVEGLQKRHLAVTQPARSNGANGGKK